MKKKTDILLEDRHRGKKGKKLISRGDILIYANTSNINEV